MKHKVGDRVRIKSREWYEKNKNISGDILCGETFFTDSMFNYCVEIATITRAGKTYKIDIDDNKFYWTDEMFEDDEPQVSETLLQDIANVIKSHNMGVQVSEEDGKLIIEPLKVDEDDLPIGTPCMVTDDMDKPLNFILRYYAGNKGVFPGGKSYGEIDDAVKYRTIIPCDKFNFENPDESLKYNIVKSE